jgi:DNA polymerase-1
MSNMLPINKVSDLPRLEGRPLIIDTETTGLNKIKDKPFIVPITIEGKSWALRMDKNTISWLSDNIPMAKWCVFHAAKYDLHMLLNAGLKESVIERSKIWCTLVHETLIDDTHRSFSLDNICNKRFKIRKRDDELLQWLADHCGGKPERKAQMKNISKAPIEMVAYYAVGDTELTEKLFEAQIKDIASQDLGNVASLEMETLKALLDMERRGVPININKVNKSLEKFIKMKAEIGDRIRELSGFDVNVRSGKQLEKAFQSLGVPITYNKDTGNPIFDKEQLASMDDDLSNSILSERSYGTMISSFLSKFPEHMHEDGRIRCDFNQTKTDEYGVITGRLSSSNPNLQQIPNPKRSGDKAAEVRAVFEAPKGTKWISNDWKQFEFRMFAHYSNDPAIIEEFRSNPDADYHQLVADLTNLKRDPYAKQLNLGLVFSMGQGLLAKKCGLPYTQKVEKGGVYLVAGKEAKLLFEKYHYKLPGVKKMLKDAERVATTRGYVKTLSGRRIRFHDKNKTYKAAGLVFQGSSADMMKMKLVELNKEFKHDKNCSLILAVHDEFNFIDGGDTKKTTKKITEIVNDMPQLKIPIRSDIAVSNNWYEASK